MQMRRLNGELLRAALKARGWKNEDLIRELKAKGYHVGGVHIVQKWLKGKNQPSAERIELIEATIGFVICDKLKPRRQLGKPAPTEQVVFA